MQGVGSALGHSQEKGELEVPSLRGGKWEEGAGGQTIPSQRDLRGNTFLVLLKDLQRNQLVRKLWPTQMHSCRVCRPSFPFPIFLGILLYYNTVSEPMGKILAVP